jgi:hypothetical protein
MNKLENLRWAPRWVSHLGCLKGCLDYLGLEISDAWLYGGTGHAFVLNVHDLVCPSGPTAWKTEPLFRLGRNLGYQVDGVEAFKSDTDGFAEGQRKAWALVREAIDDGVPCFGWELQIPEYYVVYGYDETGYYFSGPGCDAGSAAKPWTELGDSGIGVLEMYRVQPGTVAEDVQVLREALVFALEHSTDTDQWVFPDYRAGLAGYDRWIDALRGGRADDMGMAYNAAVWKECRGHAVQFLREARNRLPGQANGLLAEAAERYQTVADHLATVADLFPFHGMDPQHLRDQDRVNGAIEALQVSRAAEVAGLESLRAIVAAL